MWLTKKQVTGIIFQRDIVNVMNGAILEKYILLIKKNVFFYQKKTLFQNCPIHNIDNISLKNYPCELFFVGHIVVYVSMYEHYNFLDICPFLCVLSKIEWFEWDNWTPPHKMRTSNFRGTVPIQFLISTTSSIKRALDERYPTKLTFLLIMSIFIFPENKGNMSCTK